MNCIHLNFVSDKEGRKFLFPILPQDGLNEKTLNVVITDGDSQRIYPVFQQKVDDLALKSNPLLLILIALYLCQMFLLLYNFQNLHMIYPKYMYKYQNNLSHLPS